jgi:hypothetical protein
MTSKMTYADLRLETFTLYAPLDEGIQTISPQGDGNISRPMRDHIARLEIQTISPQGDGNAKGFASGICFAGFKPFPRKGTETKMSNL